MFLPSPRQKIYEAIKSDLLAAYGKSQEAYIVGLDTVCLDDGRPSALMARMVDLNKAAGQPLSDELLRHRYANLMPHAIRLQLTGVRHTLSTSEYSKFIDSVYDAHCPIPDTSSPSLLCLWRQQAISIGSRWLFRRRTREHCRP